VGVIRRRDAGPDIQELPDPRLARQETHCPAQERPVRAGRYAQVRRGLQSLITHYPVSGKIVLPAKPVVIHPGLVGDAGVNHGRLIVIVGIHARDDAS
jgi:hypothetical protein